MAISRAAVSGHLEGNILCSAEILAEKTNFTQYLPDGVNVP